MRELYINDNLIELSDDTNIGFTLQVNNLGDLQTRQGGFTNEFRVPKTRINDIALGFSSNINSDTNTPYEKNTARYIEDGLEIIPNGFALVSSFDTHYYIAVYSDNADLFKDIGDGLITDMDYSEFEHLWNATQIYNQQNATPDNGEIIYPLIDWGYSSQSIPNGKTVYSYSLFACFFVKKLFDMIISEAGYYWSGSLKDSQQLYNMILTPDKWEHTQEYITERSASSSRTTDDPTAPVLFTFEKTTGSDDSTNISVLNFTPNRRTNNQMTSGTGIASFTPTENVTGEIRLSGSILFDDQFSVVSDNCSYKVDMINLTTSTVIATTSYEGINTNPSVGVTQEIKTFDLVLSNHFFVAGQTIQARLTLKSDVPTFTPEKLTYRFLSGFIFDFQAKRAISVNDVVMMGEVLPPIKKTEFIKSICNMTCSVFQTNSVTKNVAFNFFDDIINNVSNAIDWSSKIDLLKTTKISYSVGDYAQVNHLRYKKDDTVSEFYGDGSISCANENLSSEKTSVQLPFSATEQYINLGGNYVPRIKFIINQSNSEFNKIEPRVLMLDRQGNDGLVLQSGGSPATINYFTTSNYSYFVNPDKTDNLAFNENLIDNYYNNVRNILFKTKVVSAYFKLTAKDISEINFVIPIYLDVNHEGKSINGFFYINKISNFKLGKSTLVELIRI